MRTKFNIQQDECNAKESNECDRKWINKITDERRKKNIERLMESTDFWIPTTIKWCMEELGLTHSPNSSATRNVREKNIYCG